MYLSFFFVDGRMDGRGGWPAESALRTRTHIAHTITLWLDNVQNKVQNDYVQASISSRGIDNRWFDRSTITTTHHASSPIVNYHHHHR